MTALARNTPRNYSNTTPSALPLAAATTVYEGACVGVDVTTGLARGLVSGDLFAGFAPAQADSLGVLTGQTPVYVRLAAAGEVELPVTGVVDASVGLGVYATDDNTFTLTPGGTLIGRVMRVLSAGHAAVAFDAAGPDAVQVSAGGAHQIVAPDRSVLATSELLPTETHLTATGSVACDEYAGYVCTVAAGNITLYFGTDATGQLLSATAALALGPMPAMGAGTNGRRQVPGGSVHAVLSDAAARVTIVAN